MFVQSAGVACPHFKSMCYTKSADRSGVGCPDQIGLIEGMDCEICHPIFFMSYSFSEAESMFVVVRGSKPEASGCIDVCKD